MVKHIQQASNGHANFNVSDLKHGSYEYIVSFVGDNKYNQSSVKGNVDVYSRMKDNVELLISTSDILEGEIADVSVILPADITSNLTLTINNVTYTSKASNGLAVFKIPNLKWGTYEFKVSFSGDENYNPKMSAGSVNVIKQKSEVSLFVSCFDVFEGNAAGIYVILPADIKSELTLTIDNVKYYANASNGMAIFEIDGLACGDYDFKVMFEGDDKYKSAQVNGSISILKMQDIIKLNPNLTYEIQNTKNNVTLSVYLAKESTGNISLILDGQTIKNEAIVDGTASFSFSDLAGGNHSFEISYSGNEIYAEAMIIDNFTICDNIERIGTKINVESSFTRFATDFYAGERGDFFYATLTDINGILWQIRLFRLL